MPLPEGGQSPAVDSREITSRLPPQTWIAQRYRIEAALGAGAMGMVFRAHDAMLGRPVAVKVLHASLADHPTLPRRFEREAFAAAQLDHPNCVQVFDAGWAEGIGKYLVMPLLEGRSLGDLMTGPMSVSRTVDLVGQILAGLDHAHRHGFVHRDIKPDNIFIVADDDGREQAKLVDFGLVKIADARVSRGLTQAGTVFGTPAYMAPEQASGGRVDARADLYAVGATMYEMLSGRPAVEGDSFAEILRAHVLSDPAPLPDHIPHAIADFVMWLLAKDPGDRPGSAAAAIEGLRAAAEGVRRTRPPRTPSYHPARESGLELAIDLAAERPLDVPPRFEPEARPPSLIGSRGGIAGLLGGLGALAAAAAAVLWWVAPTELPTPSAGVAAVEAAEPAERAESAEPHTVPEVEPTPDELVAIAPHVAPDSVEPPPVVEPAAVESPAVPVVESKPTPAPAPAKRTKRRARTSTKVPEPRWIDTDASRPVVVPVAEPAPVPVPVSQDRTLSTTKPPRVESKLPGAAVHPRPPQRDGERVLRPTS